MKFLLSCVLLLSFVSLGVFGFLGMNHAEGHGSACLAAASRAVECGTEGEPLTEAAFHIDAFRSFSLATPVGSASALAISLFVAFWSAVFSFLFLYVAQTLSLVPHRERLHHSPGMRPQGIAQWLALHENSPSRF